MELQRDCSSPDDNTELAEQSEGYSTSKSGKPPDGSGGLTVRLRQHFFGSQKPDMFSRSELHLADDIVL